jgi:hypothetical protein
MTDERHTGELDLFRVYLDEVGRHPLLTNDDEIELSQAYEAGLETQQGGMTWPGSAMTSRPLQRSRRSARSHARGSRSGARRYDVTCARRGE